MATPKPSTVHNKTNFLNVMILLSDYNNNVKALIPNFYKSKKREITLQMVK